MTQKELATKIAEVSMRSGSHVAQVSGSVESSWKKHCAAFAASRHATITTVSLTYNTLFRRLCDQFKQKPQVIADFEASRVPPNPQVLGKLERALKVKLRGKDIGAKLEQPSKKK